ncbi:MFS transporter [Micromonospora sp. WMMC415]|uniref:MFS transporter n=1 Tax=Micromonospora sp. WMMC415 TaxID=2675222 RepID=UPI001E2BD170|nr:MFS transporter [Micromonospora sp. WMMC415]
MRRNAVLFVAISLLSGFGSTTMSLVAGIWILDLTGSGGLAALVGVCVFAPVLAGPWLGGVVDRLPRRPTLVAVHLLLAVTLLSLLAVRDAGGTWLIFAVSLAYGISYVLIDAGESALLPEALSAEHLGDVNGWRTSAQEGVKLVAPLVGAGLYTWQGGHVVAAVSAAPPVLAAVLYTAVRLTRPRPAAPPDRRRGLRAGLAVIRQEPVIRRSVGLAAVAIGTSGFTTAAFYQVVTIDMGLPPTFLGVLLSAQGAGSIVAGLVAGRLVNRLGPVTVAAAGTVLFAVVCLARCLPWWPVAVAASLLAGLALPWALVAAVTAVQLHAPAAQLGRVAGTATTAMFGPVALATPLGSVAVAPGARPPFVLAAALCLAAAAVVARRSPRRRPAARSGPPTGQDGTLSAVPSAADRCASSISSTVPTASRGSTGIGVPPRSDAATSA